MATAGPIGTTADVRESDRPNGAASGDYSAKQLQARSDASSFAERYKLYSQQATNSSCNSSGVSNGRGRDRAADANASGRAGLEATAAVALEMQASQSGNLQASADGLRINTKILVARRPLSLLPAMRLTSSSASLSIIAPNAVTADRLLRKTNQALTTAAQQGGPAHEVASLLPTLPNTLPANAGEAIRIASPSAKESSRNINVGASAVRGREAAVNSPGAALGASLVSDQRAAEDPATVSAKALGSSAADVIVPNLDPAGYAVFVQPNEVVSPPHATQGIVRGHAAGPANPHLGLQQAAGVEEQGGRSGTELSEPHTLLASPHVLEVGITGGAHGWLRVRAELEHTGEVTASLVASSAGSADALHKQIGAISAYLKSEAIGVTSLAVTAPEKSSAMAGSKESAAANSSTGEGARRSSDQPQAREREPQARSGPDTLRLQPTYARGLSNVLAAGRNGGWLDIRV